MTNTRYPFANPLLAVFIFTLSTLHLLSWSHGDSPYLHIVKNAIEIKELVNKAEKAKDAERDKLLSAIHEKYRVNIHLLEEMMVIPREDYPSEHDYQQSLVDRVKLLEKHHRLLERIYKLNQLNHDSH